MLGCRGLRLKFSIARIELSLKGVACVFAIVFDFAKWMVVINGAVEGTFITAGTFAVSVT